MREVWSRNITDPRATVIDGTFDNINISAGWADLVVVAQVRSESVLCILHVLNACSRRPSTGVQIMVLLLRSLLVF